MNILQKYFKKKDDEILDLNTLSTVSHSEVCQIAIKFHTEFRDSVQVIEAQEETIKHLKKDLSKALEEGQLYKTHCEGLQNLAQKLTLENDSFTTLMESKVQEIKFFRDKTAELEKNAENFKNFPSVLSELENIKSKNKDNLEKISLLVSEKELYFKEKLSFDTEIKILRERYEEKSKKTLEIEIELKNKEELLQKLKSENKALKNTAKENQGQLKELEAVVNGKTQRICELEQNLSGIALQLSEKNNRLENFDAKFEGLKETFTKQINEKDLKISELHEKFEVEVRKKIQESSAVFSKNLEEYKLKITFLEIERGKNSEMIEKLTNEIRDLTSNLKSSQENLVDMQKKKDFAKEELLKLSQKIENTSNERVPVKPVHTVLPQPIVPNSVPEFKALQILRGQLDLLYKSLMDLMLNANTSREGANRSIQYLIPSEVFSKFEKDLNKIVMNTHEASENPNFIESGGGWMGKISGWAPSKLLTCMSGENRIQTSHPPEKRRSSYKGFF